MAVKSASPSEVKDSPFQKKTSFIQCSQLYKNKWPRRDIYESLKQSVNPRACAWALLAGRDPNPLCIRPRWGRVLTSPELKELRRLTAVLGQPALYSRLWHGVPKDHGDTVRGAKMGSKYRLSELNSWLLSHPQAATFTAAKVCVQIRFGFGSNREVIQLFWFCFMTCHRRYNS